MADSMSWGVKRWSDPPAASVDERLIIRYLGESAGKGEMDLEDLATSLSGWRDFLYLSTSIYLGSSLTSRALRPEEAPRIRVVSFRKGSFDVWLHVILPLGLMTGFKLGKVVLKELWEWRKTLLEHHVSTKKSFSTKEEAVEALKGLALHHQLALPKEDSDCVKVEEVIDESLQAATRPIARSASHLTLNTDPPSAEIRLGLEEKRALESGFFVEGGEGSAPFERTSVKFIRINTQTGRALITFEDPVGEHQEGQKYSRIIDPAVHTPGNTYTRAFHEGSPLALWTRIARRRKDSSFAHWQLTIERPKDDAPLISHLESDRKKKG